MSRKILLFLSSESFHACVWNNGTLGTPVYFSNSHEDQENFSGFLQENRHPTYLMVDLIEEDFRQEIVPHLTGSTQQALIQRKFEQFYRNTPFRMASLQKRLAEGRRDDDMLFSAITNPNRITTWLDLLLRNKTPIVGIYTVPQASLPLVKDIASNHLLLLTWEKDAGLRQTYYLHNRLRFSRLTPLPPEGVFADAVSIETARTYQYLQSLSLTPPGEMLSVFIICHTDDRAALDERLAGNQYMAYAYLDLQQLSKQLKASFQYSDSDATPLLLNTLATQPPRSSYASSQHTHFFQLWQIRRVLFGLAAATALACLVWSMLLLMQGNGLSDEIGELNTKTTNLNREIQRVTQQFPTSIQGKNGSTVQASDMKTAVTLVRNLEQQTVPPQQLLKGLTTTLTSFPRISTSKISWQASVEGSMPVQEITFNGELLNFGSEYRDALGYLERFQLMLTRTGYSVTPIKLPLDFSSKGTISADSNLSGDKPSEFSLKIIWRPQQ